MVSTRQYGIETFLSIPHLLTLTKREKHCNNPLNFLKLKTFHFWTNPYLFNQLALHPRYHK